MMLLVAVHAAAALTASPDRTQFDLAAAIAAAAPGDTIHVPGGVHTGLTVTVDRPLVIIGDPGAILDGEGARELITVTAPDVTIRGLTFRNTGRSRHQDRAALHLDGATACSIESNRFDDTFFAVYLTDTVGCRVVGNIMRGTPGAESATGNAIHSWGSRHLLVSGNRIAGHRDGVYLEFTRHATVRDNISESNSRYGLHFMYADSSAYEANVFRANGSGVAVMYSRDVVMRDNRFTANRGVTSYALLLKDIVDVRLLDNRFDDNTVGILADGAERLLVRGNTFAGNGWAVRLLASTGGGMFTGNRFDSNSFDVAVNGRGTTSMFRGNWWDSYRGWDLDGDGSGDIPHHPVRLFAMLVERVPSAMLLQRSLFVRLLDAAERTMPVLTPANVADSEPLMRPPEGTK
jgi:nitrous oxidase accessory protein